MDAISHLEMGTYFCMLVFNATLVLGILSLYLIVRPITWQVIFKWLHILGVLYLWNK